jgi:hypothetical protein
MWFLGLLRFARFWMFLVLMTGVIAVTLPIFLVVIVFMLALMLLY